MENKEYLNEEQYQKNNAKVKSVGKVLLIIGIVILIIGFILMVAGWLGMGNTVNNQMSSISNPYDMNSVSSVVQKSANSGFGNVSLFAIGGFMDSIGFLLVVVGGVILLVAHRREITAYTNQQTMPIAQEGITKMAPTVGDAAGTIAKGIKKGLKDEEKQIDVFIFSTYDLIGV